MNGFGHISQKINSSFGATYTEWFGYRIAVQDLES